MERGIKTFAKTSLCMTFVYGMGCMCMLAIFMQCAAPSIDYGLPLTQFRRSVLDQQVRMMTLRYGNDRHVAYSLDDPPHIYKVWRGGVTWNGVNYNNIKQIQPETYGETYLSQLETTYLIQNKEGEKSPVELTYGGYTVGDQDLTFYYGVDATAFGQVEIHETPVFIDDGELAFLRIFTVEGLPNGSTFYVDSTAIGTGPMVVSYPLESVPPTPYPAGEVIAKTSHYWLDKAGCNTCHAVDYKMVGPSYKEIAAAYDDDKETISVLVSRVKNGATGTWGEAVMIPHPNVAEADLERMVMDILSLVPKSDKVARPVHRDKIADTHEAVPGFGSALVDVHPAYTLETIRPSWFRPRVGSMEFSSDGKLYVGTWDSIGSVFQLTGVETSDTNQIEIVQIASGLAEPLGMEVVGNDLYVMQKHELTQLIDHDRDEKIDEYKSICHSFDVTTDFHEFAYDVEYVDGYFFGTLGIAMRLMTTERQLPHRGTVFRLDPQGDFSVIAEGLRQPNGIGVGVDGELFTTENQGRWVPACKLIHIKEGDFHGCVQRQGDRFDGRSMTPPTIWLPQDEIGNSPSEPLLMTEGIYAGQMIFGEVTHGGINRAFLEKVDGAYQGCVFRFCQGLEAGVQRILRGPDGALYVGGVGMTGGWSHKGRQFGLQKLVFNQKVPFEMLSIRATADGFDIEFTKPLSHETKMTDIPLSLSQWYYQPTAAYGGPKLDKHMVSIKHMKLSEDGRTLSVATENRKLGYVIYFSFDPTFESADGERLWSGESWYTLNAVPEINI